MYHTEHRDVMIFRLAEISDLPQIKSVFKVITENMNRKNGQIWDDFYPCEFFEDDILNKRLYVLMDAADCSFVGKQSCFQCCAKRFGCN